MIYPGPPGPPRDPMGPQGPHGDPMDPPGTPRDDINIPPGVFMIHPNDDDKDDDGGDDDGGDNSEAPTCDMEIILNAARARFARAPTRW